MSLSIQMARRGHVVALIEKEQYPFHRVCGEYISLESWEFLCELGIDLTTMELPIIKTLQVSSLKGKALQHQLPLGGFGISRYLLDDLLAKIARSSGVELMENTRVNDIVFANDIFTVQTAGQDIHGRVVCGCFGKRSNIDVKWKRPFILASKNKLNNYIGVKYHIRGKFPTDVIALHNFSNGYCGIVKVDADRYCLCYLTTAQNLKQCGGEIDRMEETILSRNPHLRQIFKDCEKVFDIPITISAISFDKKKQVENHVLMIGDAAGMITPLCGNGMSMALHASKIAAAQVDLFLKGRQSRKKMEEEYGAQWQKLFARRLSVGRQIQRLVTNSRLVNLFITIMKPFPGLTRSLVKRTHGDPF